MRKRNGAVRLSGGEVEWRVWAPRAESVELVTIEGGHRKTWRMEKEGEFFRVTAAELAEPIRYWYKLNGGAERPDPCSLWQPEGVPGPSAVFGPERFEWHDEGWEGIPRQSLVFYELHVGAFTREGTFEAIIPRLGQLRELGITAIELMPIGQFPGDRNWGYDGVLPYAAQNSYGGPEGLQRLVDAAHGAGLGVVLDVVYNHFGPEHNYIEDFGPYMTDQYRTPWGRAVNYDGAGSDEVRSYVVNNARMWLEAFHVDGLRLDAVHAIFDMSARHILEEIKEAAEEIAAAQKREIHVIAESDLNDPRLIRPAAEGGYGLDAQWSDDFHHAAHAYLTGEQRGYYRDYGERRHLAQSLKEPFVYAGQYSMHRKRKHGASAAKISGDRFVVCLQNHDQVGNRARGDRLTDMLGSHKKLRLAASLLLLAPHLPLLFMGEEYGETNDFPFFCSFCGEELIQAVREGRKREFADFVSNADEIPVPDALSTFQSARLSWAWPAESDRARLRRLYKDLLALRRELPALRDFKTWSSRLVPGPEDGPVLELVRGGKGGTEAGAVVVLYNLTGETQSLPCGQELPVQFTSEATVYGGPRCHTGSVRDLIPYECVILAPGTCSERGSL